MTMTPLIKESIYLDMITGSEVYSMVGARQHMIDMVLEELRILQLDP